MPYPTIQVLEQHWNAFAEKVINNTRIDLTYLPEIQKLMTAVSVIDLSLHEIYKHCEYVHDLTMQLLNLKKILLINSKLDETYTQVNECCELWLALLKQRNLNPLKIKHHKLMDGECDFRFTLQLMEEKPHGFKEVQVLDAKNPEAIQEAITAIDRLDRIAEGVSFAKLPLVNDKILTKLLEYKDVMCLIAKDQNNEIIGYSWGILLRDIKVGEGQTANVFWIMDLARDPDFYDSNFKVGEVLRSKMIALLKLRNDCDFVGYQHLLNHKFHMATIDKIEADKTNISVCDETFPSKTTIEFNDTLELFVRAYFIPANDKNFPYPDYACIYPSLKKAFWYAAPGGLDFVGGFFGFFGSVAYQGMANQLMNAHPDERLATHITSAQQDCDMTILKEIILSDQWQEKGIGLFGSNHLPTTMQKLQPLMQSTIVDFAALQTLVKNSGINLMRSKLTSLFYDNLATADSPTLVLNSLLKNQLTPREWVDLITDRRKNVLNRHTME